MEEKIIESFMGFTESVFAHQPDVIYRGVTQSKFELIPSVGRIKHPTQSVQRLEHDSLWIFKTHSLPYLEYKPSSDWDWLALAQHHGLPTRFLDWTRNPLVALFFVCEKDKYEDGAVYVFKTNGYLNTENSESPMDVKSTNAVLPSHVSRRVAAQAGIFTVHHEPDKPWVDEGIKKWIIPSNLKSEFLSILAKFGIHRATLFPDLDGLTDYIKWIKRTE